MAHGITAKDSMFSVNEVPWHGLGVILDRRPKSIREALRKAGLAWTVEQKPVYLRGGKLIEGYKANIRYDTKDVLGIVSDEYQVVQNQQAFEFLSTLIGSEMHFETAGSLWSGRAVWVLSALPDWIEVGGDKVAQYVLVTTRHDGSAGVKAKTTPIRVVCNNTLTAALSDTTDTYSARHIGDVNAQLAEARRVMGMTVNYYKQFAKFGNRLASQKCSERHLAKVLLELYPSQGLTSDRTVKNRERAREQIVDLFLQGRTVGNAPGSKWCAYNAIVEHFEHVRPKRTDQGSFLRHFDDPDGFKGRALDLVVSA